MLFAQDMAVTAWRERISRWRPTEDPKWVLEQEGFDPSREREMETLFAIGNGYLGVRGSPELLIPASQSDLFIAGIFDRKSETTPYSELEFLAHRHRPNPYSEIVPFPFPFRLELHVGDQPLRLIGSDLLAHARFLDLRQGLLFECFEFSSGNGARLRVRSLRCASLSDPHLLIQEVEIGTEGYSGTLRLKASMEPQEELAYTHLKAVSRAKPSPLAELRIYETLFSGFSACFAARLEIDGGERGAVSSELPVQPGQSVRLRRYISAFAGRDLGKTEESCIAHLSSKTWSAFDGELASHSSEWEKFWKASDLDFEGSPELTHAQHFNLYHLRCPARLPSTEASEPSPCISIGARALTGRAYEGHVFWDAEIFMLPFYLYTEPQLARELLLYRYGTLSGARARARKLGFAGACYAWESTLTGEDVTPRSIAIKGTGREIPVFTGSQQIHISADVAFAIWRYWDATLDEDFLRYQGAEILVETARFWASRCAREGPGLHIRHVVGPDEYHFNVSDNAYTNWMARFNLNVACRVLDWLSSKHPRRAEELAGELALSPLEPERWKDLASRIATPRTTASGVMEQFEGFFNLKPVTIPKEDRLRAPISRLFEWKEVNRLRVVKQADVLMIPFLFPEALSARALEANYSYYEPLTDHGSSLSVAVHAAIAARVGRWEQAREFWDQGLAFDLRNTMHNTQLGIHAGCIGGTWQALVFHLLGIRLTENGPLLPESPWLPPGCSGIELNLTYRGRRYPLQVRPALKRKAVP